MYFRIGLAALVVAGTAAATAPAHAEEARTLAGPGTGDAEMFVTYVGCQDFFGPTTAPQSRLNLGPGAAPRGRRSLGLVPTGPGTASGPYTRFASLAALDASFSATSQTGTSGVSYVWVTAPDALPGTAWSGRAETSLPAGGWQQVDAGSLTYTWQLVDLATRRPVAEAGTATAAEFAAAHGDGGGYVVTGFGCDGRPVNIDAVRSASATWDFEGMALSTTIAAGADQVPAGEAVVLSGRVSDASGRLMGDPLVLETRAPGGQWRRVGGPQLVDPDGTTRAEARPEQTAEYRWYRPESQYADEGWSEAVLVRVQEPAAEQKDPGQQKDEAGRT